jgi:hypothetical protein
MDAYTTQQLMAKLPNLPPQTKNSLPSNIIHGFSAGIGQNRFVLVNLDFRGPHNQRFVPDPKVNLYSQNASRRRIMTLDAGKAGFMHSLNQALKGGEDYPILTGLLGIAAGIASAGAGILFSLTTIAVSAGKTSQPIRARLGDEIRQVELVGKEGQALKHVEYFLLVDPYRAKATNIPSEWVIHEERRDLVLG